MSERIRAFVALPAPSPLREALVRTTERVLARAPTGRGRPRGVRPGQLHLTLKFLGDVTPQQLEPVRAELVAAAARTHPIDARLRGVTAFPSPARARVIVAELEDGSGSIDVSKVKGSVLIRRDGSGSISVRNIDGDFTVERDGSGSINYRDVGGKVDIPRKKR